MPENSWRESDSYNDLESLSALLADLSHLSDDDEPDQPQTGNRRRRAAVALVLIWSSTVALNLLTWGSWVVLGLTTLMGLHVVRVLCARPLPVPDPIPAGTPTEQLPFVSLLVAAKNEEAVIRRLVESLCAVDYPAARYELWIIDDNSTDSTPLLLDQLLQQYEQLRVFQRPVDSTGGKSGALNQVLPLTKGDIIAVFDADAQVAPGLLRQVLPLFQRQRLGAVQVRKAIANRSTNWLTQGQAAEMALDTVLHQQRAAIGGIGELRGNGQFVRRVALERCGGWNEATITDDLDLTLRLHLDHWDIEVLLTPAVLEEGVARAIALWHQRNRWAEGGYQRYLDYWQPLLRNRLGVRKTVDLFVFWMAQYAVPTAAIPDLLIAVLRHRLPLLGPLTSVSVALSLMVMTLGLRRVQKAEHLMLSTNPNLDSSPMVTQTRPFSLINTLLQALYGTLYLFHWFPVVASTTVRISVRPNRLRWVKTVHHG